jgi:surface polysaccharide O-acyltransferase-like enzyme
MDNRIVYVDILRIFATFSVVLLHVAAGNWGNAVISSFDWKVFNFYDSLVRFGVPIFVMVSGMFLLNPNKKISYKDIYSKYILRIVIAFISWSLLYAIYNNLINYDTFDYDVFIRSFIFGHYHMWYLYMIVGLYIITPLIRNIAHDKKATEYFLLLSLVFTSLLPIIVKFFNLEDLNFYIKKFDLSFTFGYVGYYIGGYYFNNHELTKQRRNIIYFLGILGLICTYVLTDIVSLKTGKADSTFYSYFAPNVLFVSLAVFIFFKYEVSKINVNTSGVKLINILSDCSFRIYLVHDFFNIFLLQLGFNTLKYNPILSVPFAAIIVFTGSLIISYTIGKTPFLKRIL